MKNKQKKYENVVSQILYDFKNEVLSIDEAVEKISRRSSEHFNATQSRIWNPKRTIKFIRSETLGESKFAERPIEPPRDKLK